MAGLGWEKCSSESELHTRFTLACESVFSLATIRGHGDGTDWRGVHGARACMLHGIQHDRFHNR